MGSEFEAARLYDKLSIIHNGSDGKSNFEYSAAEVQTILDNFEQY